MIKIVDGDLLAAKEDILGHQVNCQGVMGVGVAKGIRESFPEAYEQYKTKCKEFFDPRDLLGACQIVKTSKGKYVANLFGQLDFGRSLKRYTNYEPLEMALRTLKEIAHDCGYSVALPYGIGCGMANGDWDVVYPMIDKIFEDYSVTLYRI